MSFHIYFIFEILLYILISSVIFYYFMTRKHGYWKKKGIPHSKPNAIFGTFKDMALFRMCPGEHLAEMYNKTKEDYYGLYAFHQPYLLIRNPKLIKDILMKDFSYFSDRAVAENYQVDPAGTYNLFILKNPEWKELRTKITPVFSTVKLKQMVQLMEENSSEMGDFIKKNSETEINAKDIAIKYMIDAIMNSAFGVKSHCFTDENSPYIEAAKRILTFTWGRTIQFFSYFFIPVLVKPFRMKFFDVESTNFLRKVMHDSMDHRQKTEDQRKDLIDIFLKLKNEDKIIKDDKLLAQGVIFVIAGYEAASSIIAFSLFELCLNKNVQTKLRDEIKTILAKHNGQLSYDSIAEMSYLDMVVNETLRKYPTLPFVDRLCMKDYKLPGTDIVIEKGTPVGIAMLGLHYDPEYFEDPHRYDPERFSEENKRKIVTGSYLPFGLGPRTCIGARFGLMSTKVGLAKIIANFEIEKTDKTPKKILFNPRSFLIVPRNDLYMKFKPLLNK